MLVLSRKVNQSVRIGSDITVTVTKIKGGTVRVGIEAPKDVKITRPEVERDNAEAA